MELSVHKLKIVITTKHTPGGLEVFLWPQKRGGGGKKNKGFMCVKIITPPGKRANFKMAADGYIAGKDQKWGWNFNPPEALFLYTYRKAVKLER